MNRKSELEGPYKYWTALDNGASFTTAMRGLSFEEIKLAQQLGRRRVLSACGHRAWGVRSLCRCLSVRLKAFQRKAMRNPPSPPLLAEYDEIAERLRNHPHLTPERLQRLIDAWK